MPVPAAAGLLASLASCAGQTDTAVVKDLFGDLQKVSYSSTYTSLKDNKTNKTDSWRQGMVSGNGLQGFVTSCDPYSDTFTKYAFPAAEQKRPHLPGYGK